MHGAVSCECDRRGCFDEMACVILVEDVQPEEATLAKAKEEGLPVLSTDKTAYEVCGMMNQAGIAPPVN